MVGAADVGDRRGPGPRAAVGPGGVPADQQVAEGVATAGAVMKLARKHKVSLPVLTAVARILEDEVDPREAVEQVMNLPQVPEM